MDYEKGKTKWGEFPQGNKLVDLTDVTGPTHSRIRFLNNFLSALTLNKRSAPNRDYYSGFGDLPRGTKYPFRPVEGRKGNMLVDILTNPNLVKDNRYSQPVHESPYFGEMFKILNEMDRPQRASKSDKLKKRYY